MFIKTKYFTIFILVLFALVEAKLTEEQLAKIVQNPVANTMSFPIQSNTNFNMGEASTRQNVSYFQPVIPFNINENWIIATRTIVPYISQPNIYGGTSSGIGSIQFTAMLAPALPSADGWVWGVGLIGQLPSATNANIATASSYYGIGPSIVAIKLPQGSPWVYGILINNIQSVGGPSSYNGDLLDVEYNITLIQPVINYNLPGGWYINTTDMITYNANASSDNKWTVPLGLGVGKVMSFENAPPLNLQVGAYYNVVSPDNYYDWQFRLQLQVLLPKV